MIPINWEIGCPFCKVITDFKTTQCTIPTKLVITCEICGTQIDLRPSNDQWMEWLRREEVIKPI